MSLEQTYKQLTGVDIDVQRTIWDERAIGYYGEYLVFCDLYRFVPGCCKILMNLEIPVTPTSKTEIDLLLIHETGLYVFEVKHYKGTIYGKDTDATWTQYFRTAKNQVFKNPMQQNGYHVRALKGLLPSLPVYSVVVFTNDECDIRVNNSDPHVDMCSLKDLQSTLINRFAYGAKALSMEQIDGVFDRLLPYSKMQEPVVLNGRAEPFYTWLQPTIDALNSQVQAVQSERARHQQEYDAKIQAFEKKRKSAKIKNVCIGAACVALMLLSVFVGSLWYNAQVEKNTEELNAFKQNFLHIDQIGNPYIDDLSSYVKVSEATLLPLTDDAVEFSAKWVMKNDTYCIQLNEDSKYIVMTNDGMVIEYDVFGEHLRYDAWSDRLSTKEKTLYKAQLYGISNVEDVAYIKITGITPYKPDTWKNIIIAEELEVELYDKSKQENVPHDNDERQLTE